MLLTVNATSSGASPCAMLAVTWIGAGPVLVTDTVCVALWRLGAVATAASVFAPGCSGTAATMKVLPVTMAAMPFTVMPEFAGPWNVPDTETLSALIVAPLDGLAMLTLTVASVRCRTTTVTLPAGSVADRLYVFKPGSRTAGKLKLTPFRLTPMPASTTVAVGSSIVP